MHNYSKTISRFYDSVYDKIRTPVDREFYLNEIANTNGPVLEVGVGTGRIFVEALKLGADIYGLDISENMLERLKEKLSDSEQHRITNADMRDFDLGRKFSLIIVPFRIFQHLLTVDEQLSALLCIKNHLEEGGKLIFDVFNPNLKRITEVVKDRLELTAEYAPGQIVERYLDSVPDNINQVIDITFTFKWKENGSELSEKDSFPFRYYFRFELENLVARAGLTLENIYGDFKYGELNNSSNEFVVICRL